MKLTWSPWKKLVAAPLSKFRSAFCVQFALAPPVHVIVPGVKFTTTCEFAVSSVAVPPRSPVTARFVAGPVSVS